jgi:subtilisin family serine protease
MKRLLFSLAATVALLAPAAAEAAEQGKSPYVVVLRDGIAAPDATTTDLGRRAGFLARLRYAAAVKGFAADLTPAQVERVRQHPAVDFVQPDTTLSAAGQAAVAPGDRITPGVRRIGAATATTVQAAGGAAVAVLDTGIDLAHPDLDARQGTNCIRPGTPATDDNGHGTHVAGIVGARNNGSGVVGVAPGTPVYSVKVLNAGATGTLSQFLCGIDWVTANAAALGIRVVNMSIGGPGRTDTNCGASNKDAEHKAICRSVAAGVTYVVAAGNDGADFSRTIPAAYPEVLTVTAMSDGDGVPGGRTAPTCVPGEADDRYGTYSNFASGSSALAHTIAAPGTCVVSSAPGGGTATYLGTSQAAPHVAGAVSLCIGRPGAPGPCAGLAPAAVIKKVRGDAVAAATTSNGFHGDLKRPFGSRGYGPLVAAGY